MEGEHQSFLDNLTAVANAAFGILRHQKFNYGDILNTIRKEYGFSDRLYDVHMSYQNAKIIVKGNTESIWYPNGSQIESLQIHIEDRDDEGVFHVHYDYQIEKFAEAEIERIHQQICTLLFDGIAHDYKKLNELDMLS